MSLRQQTKILRVFHSYLSQMINGRRPWNPEIQARYAELTATTQENNEVKCSCHTADSYVAHSSSGLGHRPLKAEITGSNPVCATNNSGITTRFSQITPLFILLNKANYIEP